MSVERDGIIDQAENIVHKRINNEFNQLYDQLKSVHEGRVHLNYDGLRNLCNELNSVIDFITMEESPTIIHYRAIKNSDHTVDVQEYYPTEESNDPGFNSQDPFNPYGKTQ
jgi:hypothetical protein